jgi:F-type H+-transporting ATPase subunit O
MLSSRAILRATRAAPAQRAAVSQFRSYATPSADPKPPVALYGLDGTYASALVCFVLAGEAADGRSGGDGKLN